MHTWLAIKQALTAMDAVVRLWARELGLEGSEILILSLLLEKSPTSASELALFSGKPRQIAQRTLTQLERRGLVTPARVSPDRKVQSWSLTPTARSVMERLSARLGAWEEIIGSKVDLPEVESSLRRMVESLVNQPTPNGWSNGLTVPHVSRKDPQWDQPTRETSLTDLEPDADAITRAWLRLWGSEHADS
jgi:DNA-binding MarR family transcriptional regulator